MRFLSRVYVALLLVAGSAVAQNVDSFEVPSTRYISKSPEAYSLSYWGEEIRAEVVGSFEADEGFDVSALARFFANASDADFRMTGDSASWFAAKHSISNETNYLVAYFAYEPSMGDHIYRTDDIGLDFEDASELVKSMFDAGVPVQGPGCSSSWEATDDNEITGFVLLIDSKSPRSQREACAEFMVPSSFGVYPATTDYTFSSDKVEEFNSPIPFSDKSETVFLALASAFCRNVLEYNSLQCPADILGSAYLKHKEILEKSQ